MRSSILPHPNNIQRFTWMLGFLSMAAWGLLVFWQQSTYAGLLGHESLGDDHTPLALHLVAFLLSWFLMTLAMMLPGSLPMIIHLVQPIQYRMQGIQMLGWILLGYLSPWVSFGLLAFLGDSFLHQLAEPGAPLAAFSAWIPHSIVLMAGFYQFTPVKRRFTARCRPSPTRILPNEADEISAAGALQQGLRLGIFCVGSCWSLMLLMFALGLHRVDGMLVLSGIFAVERLTPWGYRLAWVVGGLLVIWAALWVLTFGFPPP